MAPRRPRPGRDLATLRPDLAKEAFGWDATKVAAQSNEKVAWKCENGHLWSAVVCNRTNGNNCPVCARRVVGLGVNDLSTLKPDLAKQAFGWDASKVAASSNAKRQWRCDKGHTWSATVNSRSQGAGCPICAGRTVVVGVNDLATLNQELALEAHNWDPRSVTSWTHRKREWRCDEGHTWSASVGRRFQGAGCPLCSKSGFNPGKSGCLYLIESVERGMLQIGITNVLEQRLKKHAKGGFDTVVGVMGPINDGFLVQEWEKSILKYLREHGAIIAKDAGIEKFDGYKESWLRSSFPVRSLSELRSLVNDSEMPQDVVIV